MAQQQHTVFEFHLINDAHTQALGAVLAPCIAGGLNIHLHGDLGAGKTTLTRGMLRAAGVTGALRSPSYALLEPYELAVLPGGYLHHFDFYRLEHTPQAWKDAGFAEAFESPHAAIVEWPQYAQGLLEPALTVRLSHLDDARQVRCEVAQGIFSAPLIAALTGFKP
jgi:tRNA threonylcarbamoyladenosine biosynthesis protein TsaE